MKTFMILAVSLFLIPCLVSAEPQISGHSGTVDHGLTFTITGSSFGVKSPAEPLLWDDGEDKTTDDYTIMENDIGFNTPSGGYNDVWPKIGSAGDVVQTQYRNITSWNRLEAPHQYSTKYIAGCHYQHADNNPAYIGGGETYRNVGFTVDSGSVHDEWYIRRYISLDPNWDTSWCDGNNHKFGEAEEGSTMYSSSPFNYLSYRGSHSPCQWGPGETIQFAGRDIYVENPLFSWVHYEEIYDRSAGLYNLYHNNKFGADVSDRFPDNGARAITIGGYYRRALSPDTSDYRGGYLDSNYRYFDDIYVDTTLQRVMLCGTEDGSTPSSTYPTGNSMVCEPQIPQTWSDGSITVQANLGKITSDTAYLFVFDSSNEHNPVGYQVQVGEPCDGICLSGTSDSSIDHGQALTLTGSGFGTKDPAAPRLWDAMDSDSTSDTDTFYPRDSECTSNFYKGPPVGGGIISNPGETDCEVGYKDFPWKGMESPSQYITKAIGTCHTTSGGSWIGSTNADMFVTIPDWDSDTLYMNYWYRAGQDYSDETSTDAGENWKELTPNGCESGHCGCYLDGVDGVTWGPCGGGCPNEVYPGDVYYMGSSGPSCSTGERRYTHNPMNGWARFEHLWDNDGHSFYSVDGTDIKGGWANVPINYAGSTNPNNEPKSISLGGYNRFPRSSETGNYRLWTAVYADDTYSRVMLGNDPDWDQSTIREPQIPQTWSDGSITVTTNLGALPDGTAYLFVFNDSNDRNPTGYPISVSSSGSGPSEVCPDGVCNGSETCSSCPQDCPTGSGEVCCSGILYSGDCCDDNDCSGSDTCQSYTCTPSSGNYTCGTACSGGSPAGCTNNILADSCSPSHSCDGTNDVEDIILPSSSLDAEQPYQVQVEYECWLSGAGNDQVSIWYFNTSGWRLLQTWTEGSGLTGCDTSNDGSDGTVSVSFTPDPVPGTHYIRAIESGTEVPSGTCPTLAWGDIDDLAFTVSMPYHPADNNPQDCLIDSLEITEYIELFYQDSTANPIHTLMDGITKYYAGAYC